MDDAVIYGVAPRFLSPNVGRRFNDLVLHLPELKELGVNTLWIQPIYENSDNEQGYHVTDPMKIASDLGTEGDFQKLVASAHAHGMRVLLDFVPNHLSSKHAFLQDAAKSGSASKFYSMFMSRSDHAPYSEHYKRVAVGKTSFLVYFWDDLINFDFRSRAAREYVLKSALHWLKNFNIDGYRLDAVWGPVARHPDFMLEFKNQLKSIKPDFMLLAEDKAGRTKAYKSETHPSSAEIFDVVYDWTNSADHISEWSWSRDEETVFQWDAGGNVAGEVRKSLAQSRTAETKAQVLRYLESNDQARFLPRHSLEQTKLAAAFMYSIPGVPMLYYGQEIGYGTGDEAHDEFPEFNPDKTIRSRDRWGLWPFYQGLLRFRAEHRALRTNEFSEIKVRSTKASRQVFAFRRGQGSDAIDFVFNFDGSPVKTKLEDGRSVHLKGYEFKVLRGDQVLR
jgi:glycosidase